MIPNAYWRLVEQLRPWLTTTREAVVFVCTVMAWASRGAAALSLALNLLFLAAVGFGSSAGFGTLPKSLEKLLGDTLQSANFTITFLVVLVLTLTGGLAARAQGLDPSNPRRAPAGRAGELVFACGYSLLIALALGFTLRVVNLQTLGTNAGPVFEVLRFTAQWNPLLVLMTGMLSACYFLVSVFFMEWSLDPWQNLSLPRVTTHEHPVPSTVSLQVISVSTAPTVVAPASTLTPATAKPHRVSKKRGKGSR